LRTTVWICFFECLFIALFKFVVGLTSGSKAMLGSALYSLTDLVSAFLLIVGLNVSGRPPDRGHPYGHGKVEHLVTLLISLIVLLGTVLLLLASTFSLYSVDLRPLHWIGIWASLASLCLSHIVYRLVVCAGKQTHSAAMTAHAKHVRLDSVSNIAVIVAIGAAEIGFQQVDPLIAILEAIHILFECSKMMHKAINQLMDGAIGRERLVEARAIVADHPSVKAIKAIKGKHSGRGLSLDIEIMFDGRSRIGECKATVRALEEAIKRGMAGVDAVNIRYRPYSGADTMSVST